MKTYIYGAGNIALHIIAKMKEYEEEITGFIDSYKKGEYEGYPIVLLEDVEKDSNVVISVLNTNSILEIYQKLRQAGISNIYWFYDATQKDIKYDNAGFLGKECLNLSGWGDVVMPHIELHISDKCNLNCKGCTHFSPLFEDVGAVLEKKMADIRQLKKMFSDIFRIDILGGEPLLNPQLKEYVVELRRELPNTFIQIYTNGLLIPKLGKDVLQAIHDYNIGVSVSEYYPTHQMIDRITKCLNQYGIRYRIAEYDGKQLFNKPISISENSKYPKKCISNGCITINDGLIARCPTLMYISRFNEYFDQKLPTDGIYRISDYNNGKELLDDMKREVPLCKHCIECDMEWSVCGSQKQMKDFAVED